MKRARGALLGLAVGGLALAVAARGVPVQALGDALRGARPGWLAVPAALFLLQQLLRAWRQALLVRASAPEHRVRDSLSVLCVSFLFINTLPARMGEGLRPLLLAERAGLSLGAGLSVVLVERAVDLGAMCALVGVAVWTADPGVVAALGLPPATLTLARAAAVLGGAGAWTGLVAAVVLGPGLAARVPAEPTGGPLRRWAGRLARGVGEGLGALRSGRRFAGVAALTALTWGVTGLMYPALARAFSAPAPAGWVEGLGLLGWTMLGTALPAAPGFAGTYEAALRAGLAWIGLAGPLPAYPGGPSEDAVALAMALTLHWGVYGVQAATAVFFLGADRIDPRRLIRAALAEPR